MILYINCCVRPDFSFGYIKELATQFFGIPEARLIKAEMLDAEGFDAENGIAKAISQL